MVNNESDISLAAWMSWVQFAILAVPLLIFMAKLEWQDWKEAHPRAETTRRPRTRHAYALRTHSV